MPKSGWLGWQSGARSLVDMSNERAVYALFWAMSIEPSQAPSMRANAVRLLPSLRTAMFIGTPFSSALAGAASTTACAALNVTESAISTPSSVATTRAKLTPRRAKVPPLQGLQRGCRDCALNAPACCNDRRNPGLRQERTSIAIDGRHGLTALQPPLDLGEV